MRHIVVVVIVVANAGCLRSTQFECTTNDQCGVDGRCESVGSCSFFDPTCTESMQRFGDFAGERSNTCVAGSVTDGGIDTVTDAPTGCPSDFMPITNGTPGHVYKRIQMSRSWDMQRTGCAAQPSAYLGIPDSPAELQAIAALNGGNKVWLGISDQANEGMFVNVKGVTQTFLPWKSGFPTTSPPTNNSDCVLADSGTEIADDTCQQGYPAVCECP